MNNYRKKQKDDGVQIVQPNQENPMLADSWKFGNSPQKKSQFYRQNVEKKKASAGKVQGKAHEFGNPEYVCFKIGQIEFYVKAVKFARHSQYFSKMQSNIQVQHAAEEFKAEQEIRQKQIVMRLSKNTLPSDLVLIIKYIEDQFLFDTSMKLETSFQLAQIADELKMRNLESELLCERIIQLINKENVVNFLNTVHEKVIEKGKQYHGDWVMVPHSDSGSEDDSDEDKSPKKKNRRRRSHSDSSESDNSSSEPSDNSSEDNYSSGNERSQRAPKLVQMDIPIDKNEIIEELRDSEESWKELESYCIDLASNNLNFIMESRGEELVNKVKVEIVEQIIEKNMQFYRGDPSHDNRSLIAILKQIRNCRTVFELLKLEKDKIVDEQRKQLDEILVGNVQRNPILTWTVNNLTNYFYKQSNSIQIEGANWRLALSYFKKQSTCLKVDIKIMNSPFDTKIAKEYFKKQSLAVPANLDVQKIDPMAQFEVEEVNIEDQQHCVNQLNASAAKFTNHAFVSFVASVDLFEDQPLNLPVIHSLICSQKQPVQLISVDDFDIQQLQGDPLNVSLNFSLKEMHSQLLCYISKHFTHLINEPEIRFLSKDDFKLLLRHKYLNVTQEDEVIKAICLWLEGQSLMIKCSKYANVPKASLNMVQGPNAYDFSSSEASSDPEDDEKSSLKTKKKQNQDVTLDLVADLNEILLNVNWDYVTLPCLLDVLRTEPLFRKCDSFRVAVKAQFNIRINNASQDAIDAAHTSFNNEPRFCYKYNTSQRNLYPNEEELAAQNRPNVIAKSGIKSQFQLLYPVQLYPDFISHLIDCMINPMDIVKNWSLQSNAMNTLRSQGIPPSLNIQSNKSFQQQHNQAVVVDHQAIKRRMLQQQLLNKKLEMKHIEDQLQAMDLLDNLNQMVVGASQNDRFFDQHQEGNVQRKDSDKQVKVNDRMSQLDEKIEKAKRLFKMRIDQSKKFAQGEEGNNSGRIHVGQVNEAVDNDSSSSMSDQRSLRVQPEEKKDDEVNNNQKILLESSPAQDPAQRNPVAQVQNLQDDSRQIFNPILAEKNQISSQDFKGNDFKQAELPHFDDQIQYKEDHEAFQKQRVMQNEIKQAEVEGQDPPLHKRLLSDCVEEEKIAAIQQQDSSSNSDMTPNSQRQRNQMVPNRQFKEKGASKNSIESVSDYQQLQACRQNWSSSYNLDEDREEKVYWKKDAEQDAKRKNFNSLEMNQMRYPQPSQAGQSSIRFKSNQDSSVSPLSPNLSKSVSSSEESSSSSKQVDKRNSMKNYQNSKEPNEVINQESKVPNSGLEIRQQPYHFHPDNLNLLSNSHRLSIESNEQLQYNQSINRFSQDEMRINDIPLSAHILNEDQQLKNEVSKHLKSFNRFASQNVDFNLIKQYFTQQSKETQTEHQMGVANNNNFAVSRHHLEDSEAQTEIDMEFMVDLLQQLHQKQAFEKQLFIAKTHLFKYTNSIKTNKAAQTEELEVQPKETMKSETSESKLKNSSQVAMKQLPLTQTLAVSLEIVVNNFIPNIQMLELNNPQLVSTCPQKTSEAKSDSKLSNALDFFNSKSSDRERRSQTLPTFIRRDLFSRSSRSLPCFMKSEQIKLFDSPNQFRVKSLKKLPKKTRSEPNNYLRLYDEIKGLIHPHQELYSVKKKVRNNLHSQYRCYFKGLTQDKFVYFSEKNNSDIASNHEPLQNQLLQAAAVCEPAEESKVVPQSSHQQEVKQVELKSIQSALQIDIKLPDKRNFQLFDQDGDEQELVLESESQQSVSDASSVTESDASDHRRKEPDSQYVKFDSKERDQKKSIQYSKMRANRQNKMEDHRNEKACDLQFKNMKINDENLRNYLENDLNQVIVGPSTTKAVTKPRGLQQSTQKPKKLTKNMTPQAKSLQQQRCKIRGGTAMAKGKQAYEKFVPSEKRFAMKQADKNRQGDDLEDNNTQQSRLEGRPDRGRSNKDLIVATPVQEDNEIYMNSNEEEYENPDIAQHPIKMQKGEADAGMRPSQTPMGMSNRKAQKLEKFLIKHGVAGNCSNQAPKSAGKKKKKATGSKPSQPQQQQRLSSQQKNQKPKDKNYFKMPPPLRQQNGLEDMNFEKVFSVESYSISSSKNSNSRPEISDDSPKKLLQNEPVQKKLPYNIHKIDQSKQAKEDCETKKIKRKTYQRKRHQSEYERNECFSVSGSLMRFQDQFQPHSMPEEEPQNIMPLMSVGYSEDDASAMIAQPIEFNVPSSQNNESITSSSVEINGSLARNGFITSKDQGLACFNILDHFRQSESNIQALIRPQQVGAVNPGPVVAARQQKQSVVLLEQLRESHILMQQSESRQQRR